MLTKAHKIILGVWFVARLLLIFIFGPLVFSLLINSFANHKIQLAQISERGSWPIYLLVFLIASDVINYSIVKNLGKPGSFIKRMFTLSGLDIVMVPLSVIILIIRDNITANSFGVNDDILTVMPSPWSWTLIIFLIWIKDVVWIVWMRRKG